jgi:hypothetical protein
MHVLFITEWSFDYVIIIVMAALRICVIYA